MEIGEPLPSFTLMVKSPGEDRYTDVLLEHCFGLAWDLEHKARILLYGAWTVHLQ